MRTIILVVALAACVGGFGVAALRSTRRAEAAARASVLTGGDPERGKLQARALGCVACHVIPGVRGPQSNVGPSLADFATRNFLAGATENTPDQVRQFLRDPRSVAPKSAMPKIPMTDSDARDLSAYLYTLR